MALPRTADAVVVGAGLAGLAAARVLTGAGLETVVLEAGDGVGGRVRTDVVDGFRLDRGFQVLSTGYPEVVRVLDLDALDLQPFARGAVLVTADGRYAVGDPRRWPAAALGSARALGSAHAPLGPPHALLELVRFSGHAATTPPRRIIAAPERSTASELERRGITGDVLERFVRPLLAGIVLDESLSTSARFVTLVWRTLLRGTSAVPAAGMGAIGAQLADRLPAGTVRLSTRVRAITPTGVLTDAGPVTARTVVVAADPRAAVGLLDLPPVPMRGVSTYYHLSTHAPGPDRAIVLDARGPGRGPVVTTVVLSNVAPSYAPDGRALVASSVLGREAVPEAVVRAELAVLHGADTRDWVHLATVDVPDALPAGPLPPSLRLPVRLAEGRYVAGDHRDTPSIQGALVSGRRAARAVLRDLGLVEGPTQRVG
ncbi:NAD(P)/FAD-dependent oxidoreductase [Actinotalea sp.]|uniref:NAD(P)/FAD-dependent oxidoreductase n=1 Tax=Actinotalea sp. TaxID=1872145 RepID=UPI002C212C3C|nr:NAD(P)/FAD-dependent oxidoreductase [Actinotalea sp.]HQY33988.1 NAD(P)/FAD-dependent oxidoreductase [Actinotalea sp.]HRA50687.1 NAD(P)/FAD-dependent oxidoreductase [Actinotalea sp.]